MVDAQVMGKLRQVVSDEDPKAIYRKLQKIGQGYVVFLSAQSTPHSNYFPASQSVGARLSSKDAGNGKEGCHQGDERVATTKAGAHRK